MDLCNKTTTENTSRFVDVVIEGILQLVEQIFLTEVHLVLLEFSRYIAYANHTADATEEWYTDSKQRVNTTI